MLYFQINSLNNNIISSQYDIEIQEFESPLNFIPSPLFYKEVENKKPHSVGLLETEIV